MCNYCPRCGYYLRRWQRPRWYNPSGSWQQRPQPPLVQIEINSPPREEQRQQYADRPRATIEEIPPSGGQNVPVAPQQPPLFVQYGGYSNSYLYGHFRAYNY